MKMEDRITASDVLIRLDRAEFNHNLRARDIINLRKQTRELDQDLSLSIDRIEKLEQEKVIYKQHTIDSIHARLNILEQMHAENIYKPIESGKKPHKCPLCEGDGWDKKTMPYVGCEACGGKGILWG